MFKKIVQLRLSTNEEKMRTRSKAFPIKEVRFESSEKENDKQPRIVITTSKKPKKPRKKVDKTHDKEKQGERVSAKKHHFDVSPKKHHFVSTAGWKEDAPHTQTERHKLYDACGQKCFLMAPVASRTRAKSILKFPICRKCSASSCSCAIDPRGVEAAYRRARQWGYVAVAERANRLRTKS
jgi:hypothetical protein